MGLIKAIHVPPSAAPFSMRDIETQARAILVRARRQADGVLAEAQEEAQRLKAQAREQGVAQGRAEGLAQGLEQGQKAGHQQALAEHGEQLTAAVTALTKAMVELDRSRLELEARALKDVIELAIAIAGRITRRQAMIDTAVLAENLAEAMALVVQSSDVRVAVNPAQRRMLEEQLPALRLRWPNLKHVELVEDAQLAPGGCRIFTRHGEIDASIDEQLERIVAELLPADT